MPDATPTLMNLIGSAVAPAALITTSAILLSGYSSRQSSLSSQMRLLTAELRDHADSALAAPRSASIRRQLVLFQRRLSLIWSATVALSVAMLLFVVTVIALVFGQQEARLGIVGSVTLVAGLVGVGLSIWLDLYEIVWARQTTALEFADALNTSAPASPTKPTSPEPSDTEP
ncbi:MAG: DUF2721 domain-containing protein [Cytophagales bacterium]|nr:DUF2721 domain-containing protein [Armatimonadota bacterium]